MEYLASHASALATAAIAAMGHLLLMRASPDPKGMMRRLAYAFTCGFIAYVGVCFVRGIPLKAAVAGAFLFGFLTLGYMELMFKTYRGFSHTLLTDIYRMGEASLEEILREFAEGIGKNGMIGRRLNTMEKAGLIRREEGGWVIMTSACPAAKFGVSFKKIFFLGKGG